jgi:hypothetical protein
MRILLDNDKQNRGALLIDIGSQKMEIAVKKLLEEDLRKAINMIRKTGKVIGVVDNRNICDQDINVMIRENGISWEVK